MPAASAPASTQPNLKGCGAACRRSPPTAAALATSSWTMILRTHSIGLQPNGSAGLIRVAVYSNVSISPIPTDAPNKKPRAHAFAEAGPERTLAIYDFPPYGQPLFLFTKYYQCLRKSLVAGTAVNIPRRHQWRSCCRPPPLRLEYRDQRRPLRSIAGPRNSCPQRFSPRAVRRLRPHLARQSAGPTDAPCPGSRRGRQGYLAPREPSARSRTHRGRALVRILGTAPYSRASRQAQLRDGPLAPCPSSRLSQLASPARRCTQAPARAP